ncbi:GNAT family N-acetyltransferase [Lihuaxuella thermophila]|uniref:Protein N-acetyltransferase, RimJ/RimL family n=1 Tax=Lihuaxuella thermophila TaxID=1173111 RepID=A0A1H8GEI6_9BACL|nr:GNAT family N-acetyltransferase [Lihuaxuella thermophila]SEN42422.1 Protein N-acetyltransferase, RimJ/RimL family [Lihuaxuella thermophila]
MKIRVLTKEDAPLYWPVRLRALKENPEAFGASYEESANRSLEQVAERLNASDNQFILGAFEADGQLVGLTGFSRESLSKMKHKSMIWGMYVAPEARGRGVGRLLLHEVLEKAKKMDGLEQIHLTVVTKNTPARNLYLSMGFRPYGLEKRALKVGDQYLDEEYMVLFLSKDE